MKKQFRFLYLVLLMALFLQACDAIELPVNNPPSNAVTIVVQANTSLKSWLDEAVQDFNNSKTVTAGEKPVFVQVFYEEAGQAAVNLTIKNDSPALWIPDTKVWTEITAERGNDSFVADCTNLVRSPLVIAMWQPIAESLGWPGRPLGWLDIGSIAADTSAWDYYSGGQFGDKLRLGHTHPGLSSSGSATLLAVVQAAQSKSDSVTLNDIEEPMVQASVIAFEGAVSWFSKSTLELGSTMSERGTSFLGAAVVYENIALEYSQTDPGIIPIYPFEGTFMANHPGCVNKSAGVEEQEAALIFRNYLLDVPAQKLAMAHYLRPTNSLVPLAAPMDADHHVDVNQPEITYSTPSKDAIYAVQNIWESSRKPLNLVMLIDISGSMRGDKISSLKTAATQFVDQMSDKDLLTLIVFESEPSILALQNRVGESRENLKSTINFLEVGGNTSLYDAIGLGGTVINDTTSTQYSNVMIVLTDGDDTASSLFGLNNNLFEKATANNTTIFTIAYGRDAVSDVMETLAFRGNGNFYLGTESNISAIYDEMSAAFGGSAGIGR